jgi:hypothetical protein
MSKLRSDLDDYGRMAANLDSATLGVTALRVLPPNPLRAAIVWGSHSTIAYSVSNVGGRAYGNGVNISSGIAPQVWDIAVLGDIIRGAWYATAASGTPQIGWIEVNAPLD